MITHNLFLWKCEFIIKEGRRPEKQSTTFVEVSPLDHKLKDYRIKRQPECCVAICSTKGKTQTLNEAKGVEAIQYLK